MDKMCGFYCKFTLVLASFASLFSQGLLWEMGTWPLVLGSLYVEVNYSSLS
jgi:hypothetical protein